MLVIENRITRDPMPVETHIDVFRVDLRIEIATPKNRWCTTALEEYSVAAIVDAVVVRIVDLITSNEVVSGAVCASNDHQIRILGVEIFAPVSFMPIIVPVSKVAVRNEEVESRVIRESLETLMSDGVAGQVSEARCYSE